MCHEVRRRNDCSNDEEYEVSIFPVLLQHHRCDDAELCQEQYEDRHLEYETERQHCTEQEAEVLVDPDCGGNAHLFREVECEMDDVGHDDEVAECHADKHQDHHYRDIAQGELLFIAVKPRRDECPELVKYHREDDHKSDDHDDHQVYFNRIGNLEGMHLYIGRPGCVLHLIN